MRGRLWSAVDIELRFGYIVGYFVVVGRECWGDGIEDGAGVGGGI